MTDHDDDFAYMVPKKLWERVQTELEQLRASPSHEQTGGAVAGVDASGRVDPSALLHSMAVNLSLQQSPKLEFVKYADQMLKKALEDPSLTPDERVRFLESYTRAYHEQRKRPATGTSDTRQKTPTTPASRPPPPSAPPPSYRSQLLPATPQSAPSFASTPKSSRSSVAKRPRLEGDGPKLSLIPPRTALKGINEKTIDKKLREIENSPILTPKEKEMRREILTRYKAQMRGIKL